MAEKATEVKAVSKGTCFKSEVAALMFLKADGSVLARFQPRWDTFKGDRVKVGYLMTDDDEVITRAKADSNCVEISQSEYDKALSELRVAGIPA